MAVIRAEFELFTLDGDSLGTINAPFDRRLTFRLDDIDELSFGVYLDDSMANQIRPLETVVKVWRHQPDHVGYDPLPRGTPSFCGVVGGVERNAQSDTMTVTAYSPLWRLQHRFHIDPHDFTLTTGTGFASGDEQGLPPCIIIWRMIRFTNELIGGTLADQTGIMVGEDPYPPSTYVGDGAFGGHTPIDSVLYPVKYARGQNTWDLIQSIVQIPAFADLQPYYVHYEGTPDLMFLNLPPVRGTPRDVVLKYDPAADDSNLDDVTERAIVDPGSYANYVVIQGQGDRDVDQTIIKADGTVYVIPGTSPPVLFGSGGEGSLIDRFGLYMHFEKLDWPATQTDRIDLSIDLLARTGHITYVYEPVVNPAADLAFQIDWDIGDTIKLTCNRGAMQFDEVVKRVESVVCTISDNNFETLTISLIDDPLGIVDWNA